MKKQFMVEFELPDPLSMEFIERIPEQRNMVNYLLVERKIQSYSLSLDRSVLWIIFTAESEFEVMETISKFPLIEWMTPYVTELMFHNTTEMVLEFSLN
ncbi:MAG: muconolactone Delta-isomerase family protein [Bacteroidota bacterium]